ncbi:MAG TPA: DUF1501 domain-containing protein [Pirellulaceae bacterium]|nr:DUF1501 domain-containing protein [Pirellulaceae bacterium]
MTAITLLGSTRRPCSGPTRRETLRAGALSLLGGLFNVPSLLALEESPGKYLRPAKAKSVVLLYLQGGAPTQDMFDMKPHAAGGVGGEFKPIATSNPGIEVCEHLPLTSRWMHTAAVVRSVYHNGGCHKNLPMYTGYDVNLPDEEFRDSDPPSMGSVCAYLERDVPKELPTYAYLPCPLGWGEVRKKAGPHGGFLGRRYDPFCTECTAFVDHPPDDIWKPQIVRGEPRLTDIELKEGITLDRLAGRQRLVEQLDEQRRGLDDGPALGSLPRHKRLAFELLTSAKIREAFDISREEDKVRDRYGRTLFGSATLLARRLVERGVRFVNVSYDNFSKRFEVSKAGWDTHQRNFPMLKETLLPTFDQTYSAFVADLHERGLLDETLVVTMGEMGRTPKINADGGRDHWTFCYSVLLAGAGIRGGMIHGASDEQAAFIKDKPVHIRDICATIYHLLGIDPEMPVRDRSGRPVPVAHGGQAVREILA